MRFSVMTLFPEMVDMVLHTSIIGRAIKKGAINVQTFQIRDFSADPKHHQTDDYTYGGGAGLLMQAQPIYDCYRHVREITGKARVIYTTPQGRVFDQKEAQALAGEEELIFLCGHYEGIDERVIEEIVTDQYTIGDYVVTGGELPVLVMIDAIARHVPGVMHNEDSARTESLQDHLLEYPQYTRPEEWMGRRVPEILLSGDHARVDAWRLLQSAERTRVRRPDLFTKWETEHPGLLEKLRKKYDL